MKTWRDKDANAVVRAEIPKIFPRLWRYSLILTSTREKADDLSQSVCIRAIERANQFEVGTRLDRWLFRMTHNMWISEVRKEAVRTGGGLISIDEADIADPAQDTEQTVLRRDVLMSVLRLPEAQRQTVVLVYVEGYSYRDTAMILNIPVGTVMSRLATARATLGAKFRDSEGVTHAR